MKTALKLMLLPLFALGCAQLPDAESARRACYFAAEEVITKRAEQLCPLDQSLDSCPARDQLADEYMTALEVCDASLD